MSDNYQELLVEYQDKKSNLENFEQAVLDQLKKIIEVKKVKLGFEIEHRIKSFDSICNKCESGRFHIKKSICELQDLIGYRIILLYKEDVEISCKELESQLDIVKKYDPSEDLQENQFGYSSTHIVAKIPKKWRSVPTLNKLEDFVFEIQVRTLAQHIWASASQDLQYKDEKSTPKQLRRSIGRISALLEVIDFEFSRMIKERQEYKVSLIADNFIEDNKELNVDILAEILEKVFPPLNKNDKYEDYFILVKELEELGLTKTRDVKELFQKNIALALEEEERAVDATKNAKKPGSYNGYNVSDINRVKLGVFYSHVGFARNILQELYTDWYEINKRIKANLKNK
jgi:ppGpp synthetase/RelA/SpoT-type nucleotidyltranferase